VAAAAAAEVRFLDSTRNPGAAAAVRRGSAPGGSHFSDIFYSFGCFCFHSEIRRQHVPTLPHRFQAVIKLKIPAKRKKDPNEKFLGQYS